MFEIANFNKQVRALSRLIALKSLFIKLIKHMLILIILFPFLGFLSGAVFGKHIGRAGVCLITTLFTFFAFVISVFLFCYTVRFHTVYILTLGQWLNVDNLSVDWCFCFDSLTVIMLCIVTSISTFVHLYSTDYMSGDPHLPRFMSYLSLFTFFMLVLVTANNFLQMFVGWEGVGVSSYLLINF